MTKQPRTTRELGGVVTLMVLAVIAMVHATEVSAQQQVAQRFGGDSHPGMDVISFSVHGGGFFSASSFAGGARFEDTGAFGASATFWAHSNLGIRGNFLWYQPNVLVGTEELAIVGEDPDVFHYSGDLVLRMPVPGGDNMSWFPYLLGGVGGKTYDFSTLESETDLTGNVGLGLELRFGQDGRWGVHTEVRDYISNLTVAELDETIHDVIWTGGISINF